jgi:hypothetical protein
MLPKNSKFAFLLFFLALAVLSRGQELFPLNEPASSVPGRVLGIRAFAQNYKEIKTNRSLFALRVMYGVTPRLSLMISGTVSNHHDKKLPKDLINHTHTSGGQTSYFTQKIIRGKPYPYLFNGFYLFAKYRFISIDDQNKHFRVGAYAEWSNVKAAHDEAEPNLIDDTGGYGAGVITTFLKNRFAASLTSGFIRPNSYFETQPDFTGGPDLPTKIYYGNAIKYNISFGYRIFPSHYTDYDQVNWNIYLEFMGKQYDAARVIQNGSEIQTKTVALRRGSYVEVHPGIQRIVKSNLRIEASVGFDLINSSYTHFTPMWTLAAQQYFYRSNKKK